MKIAVNPKDVFGELTPPTELDPLIKEGGQGSGGISLFLNNFITLLYEIAAVAVVLYLVWGALEWIISAGDKEKLANAQKRITHALIGFVILAITFALLNVFGIFTGFTSFFNFK